MLLAAKLGRSLFLVKVEVEKVDLGSEVCQDDQVLLITDYLNVHDRSSFADSPCFQCLAKGQGT